MGNTIPGIGGNDWKTISGCWQRQLHNLASSREFAIVRESLAYVNAAKKCVQLYLSTTSIRN